MFSTLLLAHLQFLFLRQKEILKIQDYWQSNALFFQGLENGPALAIAAVPFGAGRVDAKDGPRGEQ